jgi:hypothetical protein
VAVSVFLDSSVLLAGLLAALRHGIRVETPAEFLAGLDRKKS